MAQQNAQPGTAALSEQARAQIDGWVAKYPPDRKQSAVISALSIVQDEHGGYLTEPLMDAVADYLGMPRIAVYEVGTFYSMLDLEPVGRHKISVCTNISCMLCGGDDILAHIERKLGVRIGDTTADGKFTLKQEEECLAACVGAPMMAVDGHYHEKLTPERVDEILDSLE